MSPQISVIVPTFNRAHALGRAVSSILEQTYRSFELIIVDDGSTDGTEMLAKGISDPRLHYIRQENGGVSLARNTGIAAASGELIAFLDSDDEAAPQWLEKLASLFTDPGVGLACAGIRRILEPAETEVYLHPQAMGPTFDDVVALFLAGSFMVRSDLLRAAGGYANGLIGSENTELAMRLIPTMKQMGLHLRTIPDAFVTVHYDTRVRMQGDIRFVQGAQYMLEHHGARLARDPKLYTDYLAILGVGAARAGQFDEARRWFASAARLYPRGWRHWLRLVLAGCPPLARRFW